MKTAVGHFRMSEIGVDDLPEPCRRCVFWEAGGRPGADLHDQESQRAQVAKESWWQATSLEWGPCGIGAWDGGSLSGYTLVAPASYLEGASRFGRVTDDALLLAVLWLDEDADGETVAGWLVEAALRVVAARGARALEAFASPSGPACMPDESLLQSSGFTLLRQGWPYRQYRLDLRQTARWREEVEEALVGVRRVLRGGRLGRVPSLPSALGFQQR